MSTYMLSLARAREDLMSFILVPGSRPLRQLVKVADKAFDGYYYGIVGLFDAAVVLLGPPAHKHLKGAGGSSLPGAYQPEWVERGSTNRVPHDGSDNGDYSGTLSEAQSTRIVDNGADLTSAGVGSSPQASLGPLGPVVDAGRIPDLSVGNSLGLGAAPAAPALVEPADPVIDRDSPAGLAIDSISVAAAPFFSRKARPSRQVPPILRQLPELEHAELTWLITYSGEFNRTMLAKYAESRIRLPKLKPLRMRSTIQAGRTGFGTDLVASAGASSAPCAPVVGPSDIPSTPTLEAECGKVSPSACSDTPTGLALDTIAVAVMPFFSRQPPSSGDIGQAGGVEQSGSRLRLPKLKSFRLKPTRSMFQSRPPALDTDQTTPAPPPQLPLMAKPIPPQITFTSVNEDIPAAPGFSPDGSLERRNRVAPRGRTPARAHDEQLSASSDSCPSSPAPSVFSALAPSTPTDASSVWSNKHRGTGVVEPELDLRSIADHVEDNTLSSYSDVDDGYDKDNFAAYFNEDDEVISPLYKRVYASLYH